MSDAFPALAEFQRAFGRGLLHGVAPAWPRFQLHRSNVQVSLRQALEAAFPVVRQLIGEAVFDGLCAAFVAAQPPQKGWLSAYGSAFPAFVGRRYAHIGPGYLADIARLEWARVRAADAPYDPGLDLQALAALSPPALERQRLTLPPAVSLIVSAFPVFDIWAAHQGENTEAQIEAVDLSVGAQVVLVSRPEPLATVTALLEPGDAALLKAASEGADFAAAHDAATQAQDGYDLGEALVRLCDLKALCI